MKVIVTGYAGFIGSNFCRYLLQNPEIDVIYGVDVFTYAARPKWIHDYVDENNLSHKFKRVCLDIVKETEVLAFMEMVDPAVVFHFAAESHVCNSIRGPRDFMHTNFIGTFNLLEACRKVWRGDQSKVFYHVSTDEVFGELRNMDPPFDEKTPYAPRSPYAASKAASDHIVKAYSSTYGLNIRVSNCTNNFGPNQHEEKLIPKAIKAIMRGIPMTIYGTGSQIRDWLHVDDHCKAIWQVYKDGLPGNSYGIGGNKELKNVEVLEAVRFAMFSLGYKVNDLEMINTKDRPTDDQRYAVDTWKIEQIGWKPDPKSFEKRLKETCEWYVANS